MSSRRRQPLVRVGEAIERHHLALGVVVLLGAAVAAVISVTAINGLPFSDPYRVEAIVPSASAIVRPGDEVRIDGRRVGEVREVGAAAGGRRVTMELTEGEVGADATATVRLRGLAGAVFIELDPGESSRGLPSGATIAPARTDAATPLTDVIEGFDDRTRAALRRAAGGYGAGVAGRGEALNGAVADLAPTLERGAPLAEALVAAPGRLATLAGRRRSRGRGARRNAAGARRTARRRGGRCSRRRRPSARP